MKRWVNMITLTALMLVATLGQAIVPATALACGSGGDTSSEQVLNGIGGTANECNGSNVGSVLSAVVTILSYVVGIAAIIMVVIAGFKYVTSSGDSGKVGSAKSTLVYALIGVAVAALAQFLVHYVLNQTQV